MDLMCSLDSVANSSELIISPLPFSTATGSDGDSLGDKSLGLVSGNTLKDNDLLRGTAGIASRTRSSINLQSVEGEFYFSKKQRSSSSGQSDGKLVVELLDDEATTSPTKITVPSGEKLSILPPDVNSLGEGTLGSIAGVTKRNRGFIKAATLEPVDFKGNAGIAKRTRSSFNIQSVEGKFFNSKKINCFSGTKAIRKITLDDKGEESLDKGSQHKLNGLDDISKEGNMMNYEETNPKLINEVSNAEGCKSLVDFQSNSLVFEDNLNCLEVASNEGDLMNFGEANPELIKEVSERGKSLVDDDNLNSLDAISNEKKLMNYGEVNSKLKEVPSVEGGSLVDKTATMGRVNLLVGSGKAKRKSKGDNVGRRLLDGQPRRSPRTFGPPREWWVRDSLLDRSMKHQVESQGNQGVTEQLLTEDDIDEAYEYLVNSGEAGGKSLMEKVAEDRGNSHFEWAKNYLDNLRRLCVYFGHSGLVFPGLADEDTVTWAAQVREFMVRIGTARMMRLERAKEYLDNLQRICTLLGHTDRVYPGVEDGRFNHIAMMNECCEDPVLKEILMRTAQLKEYMLKRGIDIPKGDTLLEKFEKAGPSKASSMEMPKSGSQVDGENTSLHGEGQEELQNQGKTRWTKARLLEWIKSRRARSRGI